ncbi:hypothetical protein QTP88_012182 [Uroleucon formosanum]
MVSGPVWLLCYVCSKVNIYLGNTLTPKMFENNEYSFMTVIYYYLVLYVDMKYTNNLGLFKSILRDIHHIKILLKLEVISQNLVVYRYVHTINRFGFYSIIYMHKILGISTAAYVIILLNSISITIEVEK